ncbi:MAG: kelch repeat-containing protein [Thermoplasmata archaeon]
MARGFHAMAYDSESDRMILFGGADEDNEFGDTWAYDLNTNTWTEMAPSIAPTAMDAMEMAYDGESDRMILFGGCRLVGACDFNDTWAYDYNSDSWTLMNPATAPPGRHALRGAYDGESDRVIVVGGQQGAGEVLLRDVWAYDFNNDTWTNETLPGFWWASYASVTYDSESDRLIHFGGQRDAGFVQETWAYDYNSNTWSDASPPLQPMGQWIQDMAYDAESDRAILSGRLLQVPTTWAYDYNANQWTERNPARQPSALYGHRVAYDVESDRVVRFGGCFGIIVSCVNETWVYDFNTDAWTPLSPLTLPREPLNVQGTAVGGQIALSWRVPFSDGGYPITAYRVYRGTVSGDLSILTEVDGTVLAYEDADAAVGTTYYYEVTAVTVAGEGPPSEEAPAMLPDDVPPTVTITSPTEGEEVDTASIMAHGTATDNVGVQSVEVSTDGSTWTAAATAGTSWSLSVDLADRPTTIQARAIDTSGNEAITSVSITYPPPPNGNGDGNGGGNGIDLIVVAGIIGGVAATAVAVAVFLFRRRS